MTIEERLAYLELQLGRVKRRNRWLLGAILLVAGGLIIPTAFEITAFQAGTQAGRTAKEIRANGVTMDFSRPGKPMDNAMIESFNGTFRDECLNVNRFLSMEDAQENIEKWQKDYNEFRPQSSLGDLTPGQFVDKLKNSLQRQKTSFLAGPVLG